MLSPKEANHRFYSKAAGGQASSLCRIGSEPEAQSVKDLWAIARPSSSLIEAIQSEFFSWLCDPWFIHAGITDKVTSASSTVLLKSSWLCVGPVLECRLALLHDVGQADLPL